MASRRDYIALADALTAAYPEHLAPRPRDGHWQPGVLSVEDILALPGVREAIGETAKLAHMLRVIDEFTTGQISNATVTYSLVQLDADHIALDQQKGGTIKLQRCK